MTKSASVPDDLYKSSKLEAQISNVTAAITGALSKPVEHPVKAIGHLIQQGLQYRLWEGFLESWNFLVKEGRVSPDYLSTIHGLATLQELLRALNEEYIDEGKVKALQAMFLNTAEGFDDARSHTHTIELMKLATTLSTAELLILKTAFFERERLIKNPKGEFMHSAVQWLSFIAEKSGLRHVALVEIEEDKLMQKRLLTSRQYGDRSGIVQSADLRLTTLAVELCEYIKDPKGVRI